MKIKASKGEPYAEICPKRSYGDLHVWIDCRKLSAECRNSLSSSEMPIAEYMYYTAHCNEANKNYQDTETTISLYQKAAELGHIKAMLALGEKYIEGKHVPKNTEEALLWYRKAAEAGDIKAMVALGEIYVEGKYVPKDTKEGLLWYRKAAEAGEADAMLVLGCIYETGKDSPQDLKEAERWYQKAFYAGDNLGKLGLARLCELKNEKAKAAIIYEELAKTVTVPPSFFLVFSLPWTLPAHGLIVDVLNQTTEQNSYDLSRRGYAYEHGTAGVEKNQDKAVYWYQRAAAEGNSYAMYALGHFYSNAMPKDLEKAFVYFRQAAIIGCKEMCDSGKWESFQTKVEMNSKFSIQKTQELLAQKGNELIAELPMSLS